MVVNAESNTHRLSCIGIVLIIDIPGQHVGGRDGIPIIDTGIGSIDNSRVIRVLHTASIQTDVDPESHLFTVYPGDRGVLRKSKLISQILNT